MIDFIVLVFSKNINGTELERCEKTLDFKEQLEKRLSLPVELWDERLTTVAADRAMQEAGYDHVQRKEHVDELAAVLILQGYMDMKHKTNV